MPILDSEIDIYDRLADVIDNLKLPFDKVLIGILGKGESISLIALPSNQEEVFLDGTRDKTYNFQILVKSKKSLDAMNGLTILYQILEQTEDIPSKNNTYEFNTIKITNLPSQFAIDGEFKIWQLTIAINITIYGKR